jgi:hypothetical protein
MFLSKFSGISTPEHHREIRLSELSEQRWEEEKGRRSEIQEILGPRARVGTADSGAPGFPDANRHFSNKERFQNSEAGRLKSDVSYLPTNPWMPLSHQIHSTSPFRLSPLSPTQGRQCRPVAGLSKDTRLECFETGQRNRDMVALKAFKGFTPIAKPKKRQRPKSAYARIRAAGQGSRSPFAAQGQGFNPQHSWKR